MSRGRGCGLLNGSPVGSQHTSRSGNGTGRAVTRLCFCPSNFPDFPQSIFHESSRVRRDGESDESRDSSQEARSPLMVCSVRLSSRKNGREDDRAFARRSMPLLASSRAAHSAGRLAAWLLVGDRVCHDIESRRGKPFLLPPLPSEPFLACLLAGWLVGWLQYPSTNSSQSVDHKPPVTRIDSQTDRPSSGQMTGRTNGLTAN